MGEARLSLPALASQLLRDGTAVVRAEIDLAKARLFTRIAGARNGAILLVAAAVTALLGLIVLAVGLMMALATLIGFALAALIVFLILIVVAAALGWLGVRQLSTKPEAIVEEIR